jgi:MFS family permease
MIQEAESICKAPLAAAQRWLAKAPRGKFWFYFIASVFFCFGFSIFFFLFNIYLLDFGLAERSLGLIGSFTAAGGIVGTIPVGMFASRFGLRRTLTGGLLLTILFSVMRSCILWQPAQLALAALTGLTLCSWAVCLSPAVAGLTTEHQRPFAFSLMFASGIGIAGLGSLVGGRLPGWLRELPTHASLSLPHAHRAALLIACAFAICALVPISFLPLRISAPHTGLPRLSNPFLRQFLLAMFVWSLVTGSFAPFANVYFVHHLGLSLENTGAIFSVSQLVQFVAILCAPLLFRRAGLSFGIMLTQFATAIALATLSITHTISHAAWIYWAYMAVQCMNEPGMYSLLMDVIPTHDHNGASAATFFVSAISQLIASTVTGITLERFGYSPVLASIAGLAIVAAILFRQLPITKSLVGLARK